MIGKVVYISRMSAPLILLHASMAATKLSELLDCHPRVLVSILKRIKIQGRTLQFMTATLNGEQASQFTRDIVSDGDMAPAGKRKGSDSDIIFRRSGDVTPPSSDLHYIYAAYCVAAQQLKFPPPPTHYQVISPYKSC